MKTQHSLLLVTVGALAIVGCERRDRTITGENRPSARETPANEPAAGTGGGPVAIDQALSKIVEARCDREMRCGNVGADQKFVDRNACITQVKKDFADGINADDCAAGVDSKELDECLTDARKEDCNNPFDTVGRVASCRTSDLCRHMK